MPAAGPTCHLTSQQLCAMGIVTITARESLLAIYFQQEPDVTGCGRICIITGYGRTLYIRIAMVFVFSPYIRKFSSYFQFSTSDDFTA